MASDAIHCKMLYLLVQWNGSICSRERHSFRIASRPVDGWAILIIPQRLLSSLVYRLYILLTHPQQDCHSHRHRISRRTSSRTSKAVSDALACNFSIASGYPSLKATLTMCVAVREVVREPLLQTPSGDSRSRLSRDRRRSCGLCHTQDQLSELCCSENEEHYMRDNGRCSVVQSPDPLRKGLIITQHSLNAP